RRPGGGRTGGPAQPAAAGFDSDFCAHQPHEPAGMRAGNTPPGVGGVGDNDPAVAASGVLAADVGALCGKQTRLSGPDQCASGKDEASRGGGGATAGVGAGAGKPSTDARRAGSTPGASLE